MLAASRTTWRWSMSARRCWSRCSEIFARARSIWRARSLAAVFIARPAREDAGAPPDFYCFRASQRHMKAPMNMDETKLFPWFLGMKADNTDLIKGSNHPDSSLSL